jgi:hypothetical protein
VLAPMIQTLRRDEVLTADRLSFPLLLRSPGFHTGQHFVLVEDRDALADMAVRLPGEEILAIEYLDARWPDGTLLLFEANATMVIVTPDADPIWDYWWQAINRVLDARVQMLWRRIRAA